MTLHEPRGSQSHLRGTGRKPAIGTHRTGLGQPNATKRVKFGEAEQRPTRRPKVAGHNRRLAPVVAEEVPGETAADEVVDTERTDSDPTSTEPTSTEPIDDEPIEADGEGEPPSQARWPLALILAAALLVGLGSFFLVKANSVDSAVDTRGMTEVSGQVKDAVEKIFSFSYDKVDAASSAARQVLAGTAIGEYDKLIAQVGAQAPAQKLVLATRVTSIGVKSLDGDRAEVLVFLDQVATRVDTNKSSGSAAALSVKAERHSGTWKITELTPR